MKKLVAFGDSFLTTDMRVKPAQSIPEIISKKLEVPLLEFASSGSAIQYSVNCFLKYIQSEEYDPEDYILYGLTSLERVHTVDVPTPNLSVMILNLGSAALTYEGFDAVQQRWVKENIEHVLWASQKICNLEINTEAIRTLSLIQSFARTLQNRFIVVHPFDNYGDLEVKLVDTIIKPSSNFLPILPPKFKSWHELGMAEYADNDYYWKAMRKMADPRTNHFCGVNRVIIGDMLATVFETGDLSKYDTSRVRKNLITEPYEMTDIEFKTRLNATNG